jgi:hypothetical protein
MVLVRHAAASAVRAERREGAAVNRPITSPRTYVPTPGKPQSTADVSGPLPQFSLEEARTTLGAQARTAGTQGDPGAADDAFDQAPTLVRPALSPAHAAAVLRAIERTRAPRQHAQHAAPAVEELDADALVDASGAHAPLPRFADGDSIAPVMSTSEIRFFDADAAVAALDEHGDEDHDPDHASARPLPTPDRARLGRRAVTAVVGVAGFVLFVGAGVSAARPSESSSVVEEIYALARADANSSLALRAARADAAPVAVEVAAAPSTGTLDTTKELAAQTLFVDGIPMGRAPLTLACGRHSVRVGKAGVAKSLEVPCGGNVVAR